MTISGANFTGATSVTFGGTSAGSFTAGASTITAVAPAHTAGVVAVAVSTPSGGTGTLANAFTYATVPDAPTAVSATPGLTDASVSFTAPANNGGSAITAYTVTSNPGGLSATAGASPLTVTGLSPATSYTFTVTATNGIGEGAASTASSAVTTKSTQTITFADPGAQNFGTSPTLTAASTSSLAVSFTSSTTSVCTVTTGGALTFVSAGSCTINASQAGDTTYGAATTVTRTFDVNAVAPSAPSIGTATAGNTVASVSFTAPASNGGSAINGYTVTSSPGDLTATGGASPLSVTGLTNGTTYTFTVTATNAASLTGPASAASNSVVPKGNQTITFANPGAQNFGTAPTLAATATSGLAVSFTSSTTSVCTITSAGALTFVSTGSCTINADQAGNAAVNAAPQVSQTFTVNAVVPGAPTAVSATPGLIDASVSFTAPASNGGATISGYSITTNPAGGNGSGTSSPITVIGLSPATTYTFTVTAANSVGAGPASAASDPVTTKSIQVITFDQPAAQDFGTTPTLTATSSSGLTVSFTSTTTGVCTITSGGVLAFVSAGDCTINADQAGNGSYAPATTVSQTFAVNAVAPGAPSIGTATAGDTQASVSFTAPASSGGVGISGYTVTASPGSATGTGAVSPITVNGLTNGVSYTFTVTATNTSSMIGPSSAASNSVTPRTSQIISFANPGAQSFGTTPTLTATSDSTLAVSFTSATTGVCTITPSGTLSFVTAGTCTINADQAGNGAYLPATQVSRSFTVIAVVPGAPTIGMATPGNSSASVNFSAPAFNGGAAVTSYTVTSSPGGITATGGTSPITVTGLTNGAAYTFSVRATNSAGDGAASASSNSVTPIAPQTITFADPGVQSLASGTYTLVATASSGLTVAFTSDTPAVCTVSGTTVTFVAAGSCTINADQAGDGSYSAASTVTRTFAISPPPPVAAAVALTVAANSTGNPVTLNLSGGAATSVAIATAPAHGTATASGTAITYTPTAGYSGADSLGYTATNSGGTSAPATVTITVTPPTLVLTPNTLPAGNIGFAYSQTLTAAGGTGPYVYAVTSGALPPGLALSPAGALVGTPTSTAASIPFTVTATDANGATGSRAYSLTVVTATPLVSLTATPASAAVGDTITLTATVSGGLSPTGTIQFATSGASIGSPAPLVGGTASVSTSALSSGTHLITAVYSGDGNNSVATSPAVAVSIGAVRPDPAQDPTARAIVTSQAATASRVGQQQITNTVQRLEQLHDEGGRPQAGGDRPMTSAAGGPMGGPLVRPAGGDHAASMLAYGDDKAPSGKTSPGEAASQIFSKVSQAFEDAERQAELPFHLWSAGSIDWGRVGDGSDDRFTTSGLTLGIDRRLTDSLTMGLAGGVAIDHSRFGRDTSDGTAYTAQIYASLKLAPKTWLDMVGGYGTLQFDSERWSGGGLLTGDRDGRNLFGSVGLSSAYDVSGVKLTGYGRLDVVRMALDGYSESGPASWALSYDDMRSTTLSGVAGLRASYAMPMSWGTLTPGGRIEYRHALEGGFTQSLGYADTAGFGAAISGDAMSRDSAAFGLSLSATTLDGLDLDLEYLLSADGDGVAGQQVRAGFRLPF